MKRLLISLAIIMVYSLTSAPTTTAAPQSGGTAKIWISSNPGSLGYPPKMSGSVEGNNGSFACESLFTFDDKGTQLPLLATGWKYDETSNSIILTLRKGVKFHDGSDFNANVCKWNLDNYRTSRKTELNEVSSVDVVDDHTVRLILSKYQNTIIIHLGMDPGRMISKAAFDANGGEDWARKNPVGTGPFKFVSWTQDVSIKYTRNDQYWGGKPYLDGIELLLYADPSVALLDLKSGNLHHLQVEPSSLSELKASGKFQVGHIPTGQTPALAADTNDPKSPFNDLRVRQAMSYAIDNEGLAEAIGRGTYIAHNQWAIPGTWAFNPNIAGYPYNPKKAKDLLAQAGYPNGFKTTLHFNFLQQTVMDMATAMQAMLQAVGIDAALDPMKPAVFNDLGRLGKGYKGIVWVMSGGHVDPLIKYINIVLGEEFEGVFVPQELKDAYLQALTAPDDQSKKELVWKFLSLAVDKYCIMTHLFVMARSYAIDNKLKDIWMASNGRIDVSKAWFSK